MQQTDVFGHAMRIDGRCNTPGGMCVHKPLPQQNTKQSNQEQLMPSLPETNIIAGAPPTKPTADALAIIKPITRYERGPQSCLWGNIRVPCIERPTNLGLQLPSVTDAYRLPIPHVIYLACALLSQGRPHGRPGNRTQLMPPEPAVPSASPVPGMSAHTQPDNAPQSHTHACTIAAASELVARTTLGMKRTHMTSAVESTNP